MTTNLNELSDALREAVRQAAAKRAPKGTRSAEAERDAHAEDGGEA